MVVVVVVVPNNNQDHLEQVIILLYRFSPKENFITLPNISVCLIMPYLEYNLRRSDLNMCAFTPDFQANPNMPSKFKIAQYIFFFGT